MVYTSRQRTKSGSHRLAVMTVNGITKLVKVPAETASGTLSLSYESIRRVWGIAPDGAVNIV